MRQRQARLVEDHAVHEEEVEGRSCAGRSAGPGPGHGQAGARSPAAARASRARQLGVELGGAVQKPRLVARSRPDPSPAASRPRPPRSPPRSPAARARRQSAPCWSPRFDPSPTKALATRALFPSAAPWTQLPCAGRAAIDVDRVVFFACCASALAAPSRIRGAQTWLRLPLPGVAAAPTGLPAHARRARSSSGTGRCRNAAQGRRRADRATARLWRLPAGRRNASFQAHAPGARALGHARRAARDRSRPRRRVPERLTPRPAS